MPDLCPVCNSVLEKKTLGEVESFSCPLCGKFALTQALISSLPNILINNKDASPKISHALRSTLSDYTNAFN